jgi:hypothetical protein
MCKLKSVIALLTVFIFTLISGCTVYRNYTAKIEIGTNTDAYKLTTSESKFELFIPKNNLIPDKDIKTTVKGATENPRYFYFNNKETNLTISGWFEPNYIYQGMEKHFYRMTNEWRKNGLPMPENVNFIRHNDWRVVSYDMPCDNTSTPNIQAHFLKENTWINLHISYECGTGKKVADLINFLDTIRVVSK